MIHDYAACHTQKQWHEVQLRQQQARDSQIEANHAQRLRRERERLHGVRGTRGILKNSYLPPNRMSTTASDTNWSERPGTNVNGNYSLLSSQLSC